MSYLQYQLHCNTLITFVRGSPQVLSPILFQCWAHWLGLSRRDYVEGSVGGTEIVQEDERRPENPSLCLLFSPVTFSLILSFIK